MSKSADTMQIKWQLNRTSLRLIYSRLIILVGVSLAIYGLVQFPGYDNQFNLILIILLAAFSEIASTYVKIGSADMAYEVGTAVSLAVVPIAGPFAATTTVAISGLTFWLYTQRGKPANEKKYEHMLFNIGMHSIAIFVAGWVFLLVQAGFNLHPVLEEAVSFLPAAIIYDQINIWLLIGMIYLISSNPPNPFQFWRENRWAMLINISVLGVGGFLIAYSVETFGWVGVIIFFIPIILSSFAFQLYVRKMQGHMSNLENIIAERTQKLQNVMKEKDQFLAVLTHDMKSPLTTINLYANMIKDYPEMLAKKPHMTEIILNSQQTLTEIVNNILDLEKIKEEGVVHLNKELFDLIPLLEKVTENLRIQAIGKEIDLHFTPETRTVKIKADRLQLERVMQNLISNAIKYTPTGGSVQVSAQLNDENVCMSIKDNGYGIPEDELPCVFDRFRRVAKHKNTAAGTGLGLAITKALIEAHEGSIDVTSKEDEGSTFVVTLPLC